MVVRPRVRAPPVGTKAAAGATSAMRAVTIAMNFMVMLSMTAAEAAGVRGIWGEYALTCSRFKADGPFSSQQPAESYPMRVGMSSPLRNASIVELTPTQCAARGSGHHPRFRTASGSDSCAIAYGVVHGRRVVLLVEWRMGLDTDREAKLRHRPHFGTEQSIDGTGSKISRNRAWPTHELILFCTQRLAQLAWPWVITVIIHAAAFALTGRGDARALCLALRGCGNARMPTSNLLLYYTTHE
mmetsp:Transcript_106551/g.308808  ORF Transcript_106551/g.308808 Transcript_106551/m.308808 type:complete len:242 (+) Transcript_106551:738-1463(+)